MLTVLSDSQIDTSDAPELTDEQWRPAIRGRIAAAVKRPVTTSLKSGGQGQEA